MLKKTVSLLSLTAFLMMPAYVLAETVTVSSAKTNEYWWPNDLNLSPLRKLAANQSPADASYNYAKEFKQLNLDDVVADLKDLMTTSQDWWPADFGHYGPFFIRMAWHSAGTYRAFDGRGGSDGGMQRFAPLNSWPDNANLDKARRLLWPIKQKYGKKISWADLIVLAGNVAMESMGFKTYGFAGGRLDAWEDNNVNWGQEDKWLGSKRHDKSGKLDKPLAATHMGLIYVNPEGPQGVPDPLAAAKDIRETFARMSMNDEETVALIAGGHTFGKTHGAAPATHVGPEPEAAPIEQQGFGWKNNYNSGKGKDTITSGLEGAWTVSPAAWTHNFLQNLFNFDWEKTKSPAGAAQWIPKDNQAQNLVPDAHDSNKRHAPIMLTTDLALKEDPAYRKIAMKFLNEPQAFELAFAKAWFKLTHRDMGPQSRYLGKMAPKEQMIWQDPVPPVEHKLIDVADQSAIKKAILDDNFNESDLIRTAWASAASFRSSDKRGGANGARLRLAPQRDWPVNDPKALKSTLDKLDKIKEDFNKLHKDQQQVSLADVIVLAGNAAVESAAKKAGNDITVPFKPGRTDASQEQTDVKSFAFLEPKADGFRNYFTKDAMQMGSPVELLIEKSEMLNLTVPEMTVLLGGMRALDANSQGSKYGVLSNRPGELTNDFFVNLLDMSTVWKKSINLDGIYDGFDRKTGKLRWQATPVDLIFGSNSELRAVAEFYATDDARPKFVSDFVKAWTKVMQNDRFDI